MCTQTSKWLCVCVKWNNYSPTGGVMYSEHLPWGLATGTDRWTNQSARLLSQDMRGEKNSVSLFTYRLPEEMSGGNVVTNLASFPKYSKLSDFFRSVFWDTSTFRNFIVPFPFLFSDSALTSAAFWQFLGLRCHFVSCSSSPLLPSSNLPHFRLSGILRFSVHHPSICSLHPYLVSPYWWKPQQTSAPLKTSNKKIDHWVTAVWPWGQWFPLKSLCVCW